VSANRTWTILLASAVLGAGLASYATAQTAERPALRTGGSSLKTCIETTFGASWTAYNDHTILVRSGRNAFRVTTNRCPHLADPLPRISTVLRGGSSICSPQDVRLYVSDSADTAPVPCFIQSIAPVTEADARALEKTRR
jgi:hypothetical protein